MVQEIKRFVKQNLPTVVSVFEEIRDSAKHQLSKIQVRRMLREKKKMCIELGAGDKKGTNDGLRSMFKRIAMSIGI